MDVEYGNIYEHTFYSGFLHECRTVMRNPFISLYLYVVFFTVEGVTSYGIYIYLNGKCFSVSLVFQFYEEWNKFLASLPIYNLLKD
jgi:hypothetical protein